MLPSVGGGSSLRGFSSWRFRDSNSLLLQAEWRIMVNRFLDTAFFYDAGKVAAQHRRPRFRRPEERLRRSACGSTARSRRRCASSWPRATKGSSHRVLVVRGFLRVTLMSQHISAVTARRAAFLLLIAGALGLLRQRRLDARAALLSRRSDRARARIAGRVEGAAVRRSDQMYEMTYNLFVDCRLQADRRARAEHQHDRRGARLELVHQPHRHEAGHGRRDHARPDRRRAARPVEVGADPGEDLGRASWLHREGRQGRDLVPRVRSAGRSRRARPAPCDRDEDLLGARLQPGRVVPDDVRSEERRRSIRRRRSGVRPASGRRSRRTTSTRSSSASRANRTARTASSPAACCPGKILGGFHYAGTRPDDPNDLVPHEHRRELRALRVFGAWTNLTDLKAANTLDTLVTENGRTVVKHYLQDVGSTFGMCND